MGMPQADLELALGKADAVNEGVKVGDGAFTELVYPWLKIYMANGAIATWAVTQTIKDEDLAAVALDSYNKAYEMDNKTAAKLAEGLKQLENYYSQNGNVAMEAARYAEAAYAYAQAYKVQESPAFTGYEGSFISLLCRLPLHDRRRYEQRFVCKGCRDADEGSRGRLHRCRG